MVSLVAELVFSYGTLRQPGVQRDVFGRELDGRPDAIVGYDLDYVTITDPRVIAASGSDRHPMLRSTDRADAAIEGTVYAVSDGDLEAADDYEVNDYARRAIPLRRRSRLGLCVRRSYQRLSWQKAVVGPVFWTASWPSTQISQCAFGGASMAWPARATLM
jgi:hypothetical protein